MKPHGQPLTTTAVDEREDIIGRTITADILFKRVHPVDFVSTLGPGFCFTRRRLDLS